MPIACLFYLGAVEHIRRVLVEDDGLPVNVPGGGQGQAGGQEGEGAQHPGHCVLTGPRISYEVSRCESLPHFV